MILVGLAACGDDGGSQPAATDAPTTTTVDTASVEEVAGVIAGMRPDFETAFADYENDRLIGLDIDPATPACSLPCTLRVLNLQYMASTLEIRLSAFYDETHNQYAGPPPDEIIPLLEDTANAALLLNAETADFDDCATADPTQYTCGLIGVNTAVSELKQQLRAWDPYL